jgi:hypothetical protein
MSIPCSPYAMPSAMIVGERCGKRRSSTIEGFKRSKGPRGRSLEHKLSLLVVMPLLKSPFLLNLLLCLSNSLLLFAPFVSRRQRPLLFLLRLLCRKPRSLVPVVFLVGANGRPHGSG